MAKYEIMMIIDPKEDFSKVKTLVNEVFKNPQIEKMDLIDLAYEINKSKTAQYALINVEASGTEVKELSRKISISKTIWRHLAINLDTEVGREDSLKKLKERKNRIEEEFEARKASREKYRQEREARYEQQRKEKAEIKDK